MSLPISYLVDDAARKVGDPNKTRITPDDWVLFYNQSARELCEKADVLQFCAKFDLTTERRFPYPDEMTQATRISVTETPDDPDSYHYLTEKFEDEWRAETNRRYPSATTPEHYFAEVGGFYLLPRATALIASGMEITYFGIPDRIFDLSIATYQLPHMTQDYVIRRMVVYGKTARNRLVEADSELKQWYADLEGLQDRMEDRANDRRSSIAPRRNRYAGMR